jgi:hypothetical protein
MPGHTSAKVTLNTYADLFDDDLDAVAVALHARYSGEVIRKRGQNVGTRPEEQGSLASQRENRFLPAKSCVCTGRWWGT